MNALIEWMNGWGGRFVGFALPMLAQSAALIAVLFALDFVLRKRVRAAIRYAVWMLALVKLALPPSLALPTGAAYWLPAKTAERVLATAPAPVMTPSRPEVARKVVVNTNLKAVDVARRVVALQAYSPKVTWEAEVLAVWLAVGFGMGIWVAWRWRVVARVVRQSTEAPETARAVMEGCRRQWGIRRAIRVRCAVIGSPAICGVLRPVILIPPGLAENLDGAEMQSVLLHELAHYQRGDLWVNLAQIFLQVIYWYNPLFWLANAAIRRAREQAVDEMVLVEMGAEAEAYPATLLHVAKLGLGRPAAALGMLGILEPGRGLTRRILHIMNRPLPRTAKIGAQGLAAVLVLGLVALPMACRRKMDTLPLPGSETHFTEKQLAELAVYLKTALHAHPKESGTQGWPNEEVKNRIFAFGSQGASAFPVLKEAAGDPDLQVRNQAVAAMGLLSARDIPAVMQFLVEPLHMQNSPEALGDIIFTPEAIADIINKNVSAAKPYLPALESLLDHTNAGVRFRAACALAPLEATTNLQVLKEFAVTLATPLPKRPPTQGMKQFEEISVEQLMALENLQKIGPAAKPLLGALREFAASTSQELYRKLALQLIASLENDRALENAPSAGVDISAPASNAGAPPLSYQWQFDNGTSNATLAAIEKTAGDKTVDVIAFADLSLPEAVLQLGVQAGLNIQFDPDILYRKAANGTPIPQPKVTAKWSRVTPLQGMEALLDNYGWRMERVSSNSSVLIVAKDTNAASPPRTPVGLAGNAQAAGRNDAAVDIAFDDLDLPEAIRQLANLAGLDNIELDPNLVEPRDADGRPTHPIKLTEKWKQVTALQGLQALLDNYGLQATQIPGNPIVRIGARDPNVAGPPVTAVNLLENAQPATGNEVADTVSFDNTELPNAIRQLALLANLNIQFDPALLNQKGADGRLIPPAKATEKWHNISPREALQKLLDQYGWEMTRTDGNPILRVTAKKP